MRLFILSALVLLGLTLCYMYIMFIGHIRSKKREKEERKRSASIIPDIIKEEK